MGQPALIIEEYDPAMHQVKRGVIVTAPAGYSDGLDSNESRQYADFQLCMPRTFQNPDIYRGTGRRFEEAQFLLGLGSFSPLCKDCLGTVRQRDAVNDPEEYHALWAVLDQAKDNFVMICDPCVLRVFFPEIDVYTVAVYHIRVYGDQTYQTDILAKQGVAEGIYPHRSI